jgi:glutaminyl-peptide cyclotransferase
MRASAASILAFAFAAFAALPATVLAAPVSSYKIVAEFPHSTGSYTEGFFYRDAFSTKAPG